MTGLSPLSATVTSARIVFAWVPYRNVYSMETVGDKLSLGLEVNIAGATRNYPGDEKPPEIAHHYTAH